MKARGILPRAFIGLPEPQRTAPMIDNPNDAFAQYEADARLQELPPASK